MNRRMTRLVFIAACVCFGAFASRAHAEPGKLTLAITDIAKPQGVLRIAVHTEAEYDGEPAATSILLVEGGTAEAVFEGLEPGEYAVKLFHDVDDDGRLDTNPFGIPTEPYAFSNNARGRFGPAKWDDAKFVLDAAGAEQTIRLK